MMICGVVLHVQGIVLCFAAMEPRDVKVQVTVEVAGDSIGSCWRTIGCVKHRTHLFEGTVVPPQTCSVLLMEALIHGMPIVESVFALVCRIPGGIASGFYHAELLGSFLKRLLQLAKMPLPLRGHHFSSAGTRKEVLGVENAFLQRNCITSEILDWWTHPSKVSWQNSKRDTLKERERKERTIGMKLEQVSTLQLLCISTSVFLIDQSSSADCSISFSDKALWDSDMLLYGDGDLFAHDVYSCCVRL